MLSKAIQEFTKLFLETTSNQKIHLVSHFDTDGITSAAILSKTLERLDKQFSVKILKQLGQNEIDIFPEDKIILISDLGSGNIDELSKIKNKVFILDHHEILEQPKSENIHILNPHLLNEYEELCAAELSYLFSRTISEENKELAHLAILGAVGDTMEKEVNKSRNSIINEAKVKVKKGLLIYPSTRPLDKALEFSSRPFIPGVTGDSQGTYELLQEAGIEKKITPICLCVD